MICCSQRELGLTKERLLKSHVKSRVTFVMYYHRNS